MNVGDIIEVEGRVHARDQRGVVAAWSRVSFDGQSYVAQDAHDFELEVDGARIAITLPRDLAATIVPATSATGAWADVELPLRERHAAIAPAPDQRTRVESATINVGDTILVRGRVREVGAVAGPETGFRDAPRARVLAIDAGVIGVGAHRAHAVRVRAGGPAARRGPAVRGLNRGPRIGDVIRLEGKVHARHDRMQVAVWSRVAYDGRSFVAEDTEVFDLGIDGAQIEVTPPRNPAGTIVPASTTNGGWAKVELPLRELHAAHAAAGRQHVNVASAIVCAGETVLVVGRVRALDEASGAVAAVDAELIGIGPGRVDAIDTALTNPVPPPRSAWPFIQILIRALTLTPLVTMVVRTLQHRPPEQRLWAWCGAITWWGIGALVVHLRRPLKLAAEPGGYDVISSTWLFKGLAFGFPTAGGTNGMIAVFGGVSRGKYGPPPDASLAALPALLSMILPLALWVPIVLPQLRARLRVRRLLQPTADWSVIEGITPDGCNRHTDELTLAGRQVSKKQALLAGESFAQGRSSLYPVIPPGSRVVVGGRMTDGQLVSAHQPGAVVILSCSPERDPRAVLDHAIRAEVRLVAELVAVVTAGVVTLALG